MSAARLRARGWGFRHAGRRAWALRGLDLDVAPGERVLLLGPSGAGKSTLLAALAGLLDPEHSGESEGELTVDGRDPRLARDRTGLLLQDPDAGLVMATAGDDVAFGLENRAVPTAEIWPRVDHALAQVGFPYGRDRATALLSGGEKQRLALAGVLAHAPGLLLLDEPTANLDPAGAALVRDALVGAGSATGATTVLVEHRVDQVAHLVDRVVVLGAGAGVVADGPPGSVFAGHGAELARAGVWVPGHPPAAPPRTGGVRSDGVPLLAADRVGVPGRLRPQTLHVAPAEVLAVTGPNGTGKTTLAMVLAGLAAPETGTVRASERLAGRAGAATAPHRWPARDLVRRIGTVFQDPEHQLTTRRVADELALGPRLTGQPPRVVTERVDALLGRLRLTALADANPYTLSGGEKRRLSVATALATEPPLLVLDEPTFGQDRTTWAELVGLLAEQRAAGGAAIVVTHDDAFVAALADRRVDLAAAPAARP